MCILANKIFRLDHIVSAFRGDTQLKKSHVHAIGYRDVGGVK